MAEQFVKFKQYVIESAKALNTLEEQFRDTYNSVELFPYSRNTSYLELVDMFPDEVGEWKTPLCLVCCVVETDIGLSEACKKSKEYLDMITPEDGECDVLSVSASMSNDRIQVLLLLRPYNFSVNFAGFFDYIGKDAIEEVVPEEEDEKVSGELIIPDEIKNFQVTEEDIRVHRIKRNNQDAKLANATYDTPFLNAIQEYEPSDIKTPEDSIDLIYDLRTLDQKTKLKGTYEAFNDVFAQIMGYVNGTERYNYFQAIEGGPAAQNDFMETIKIYVQQKHVRTGALVMEDLPAMMKKVHRSLFQMYIIQDLINDPDVTDIKITAWNSIRCRVKGKAYITNLTFVDKKDYERFVEALAVRNGISQNVPVQTFTDTGDANYIMRFSLVSGYVTSEETPYVHIRKIMRHKLLVNDLVRLGMLEPKVRDYILDCCKNSRGIVIAGGPGSGKTVLLNALLEEGYEQSAEILVIQENDELFTNRKGVMFEHVVGFGNPEVIPVDLEELGRLALVAGANVFIIGEAKGAEICSAITLSNSGCRTAITIHSTSSTDVINKMADLAQRGYARDMEQAKRMLTSFQTIIYLKNFKVEEISEITGYDEAKKDMTYRYIYRRAAANLAGKD